MSYSTGFELDGSNHYTTEIPNGSCGSTPYTNPSSVSQNGMTPPPPNTPAPWQIGTSTSGQPTNSNDGVSGIDGYNQMAQVGGKRRKRKKGSTLHKSRRNKSSIKKGKSTRKRRCCKHKIKKTMRRKYSTRRNRK